MAKTLLSICIPVFNEEKNLPAIIPAIDDALASIKDRYALEFIFTDNCSTDASFETLTAMAAADDRVRVIRFSRNFGYQKSVLTGYLNSSGACTVQLDADLQDPPSIIPQFLDEWEAGAKVVYGVRRSRKEGFFVTAARRLFYRFIDFLAEHPLPVDTGDFRLIDRQIVDVLKATPSNSPYLRGEIAKMGFRQVGIDYDRAARQHGDSKFPLRAMFSLAVDGIISQSIVPLRLATFTGLVMALLTFLALLFYGLTRAFLDVDWPPGFTTITVLVLFSISLNALFLGIIGEYLARIYRQVSSYHAVIEDCRLGFGDTASAKTPGEDTKTRS